MANPVLRNGLASPFSIYQTVTGTQSQGIHRLGTQGFLDDRKFRWARLTSGTAIGTNKLAAVGAPNANHVSETGTLTVTAGSSRFSAVLGATAAFANEYQDGYLKIESATTGAGQIYRIRDHAAVLSGGTLTADFYDQVVTVPTGTVTWSLIRNPYADIVIQPTTVVGPAAGVVQVDWAAASTTAPIYGWIQTGGPTSVLNGTDDITSVANTLLTQWGTTTAGAVGIAVDATASTMIAMKVGYAMEAITTNNAYITAFLTIDG